MTEPCPHMEEMQDAILEMEERLPLKFNVVATCIVCKIVADLDAEGGYLHDPADVALARALWLTVHNTSIQREARSTRLHKEDA